jgi:hypothetical protein
MRRCRMVRVRAKCRQRLVTIAYDSIAQLRSLFSKGLLVCSALRGPYLRLRGAELRSSQQADVLAPAGGLLNELPRPQAQRVAGVAGGPSVDRRAPISFDVLGNVRRSVDLAQLCHEAWVS